MLLAKYPRTLQSQHTHPIEDHENEGTENAGLENAGPDETK